MKHTRNLILFGLSLALWPATQCMSADLVADPGWPRVFKKDGKQLTVYQPQVDYWHGYTNLHFRCAIAFKGVSKEEKFGVAEVDAVTLADMPNRIVAMVPVRRDIRFANVPADELARLRQAVEQLHPTGQATTLSLDRLIAYLSPAKQPVQHKVELNYDPPRIFSSPSPAILVMFMGEPKLKPVDTNRTDLFFALNTNWDVLYDAVTERYYLLNGEGWLTAPDVLKGPWTPAQTLPLSMYSLPADENWAEARAHLPGKPPKEAPRVFVSTQPAEMILTEGPPTYLAVKGTRLLRVSNTASVLFLHTGDGKLYFLVAGRCFRGGSLRGPWSAASEDLPPDFAKIPSDDPSALVKASVPGTREAADAVLLASVPKTTTVNITNVTVQVTYAGQPQFMTITNTVVQYAVNTPNQVFLVGGGYYCCWQGVWFQSGTAMGPWSFCATVPQAIYTIPPSCPAYNVTYVTVQSSTPTTVTYTQTSGYSGEYVAATGVLMFGAGMLIGAAIANNNDYQYYYPPYPCYYSYGCGAAYHYGYGGFYSKSYAAYGPYGGVGYAAGYNPATGTYYRSSTAYGPRGVANRTAAYNPYTGSYAANASVNTIYGSAGRSASYNRYTGQYSSSAYRSTAYGSASAQRNYNAYAGDASASRQVNTAYGSASQRAAYDAQTGARAAGGQVNTAYGSAGRAAGYNPTTGQGAAGRYASGAYGTAGSVRTTGGGAAAGWNTASGQGAVARTGSGNIYASNGDAVYKRNEGGGWSQNSGSGWESVSKPQYSGSWNQNRSSMESAAQSRSWGNQQHQSAQSWQRSGGGWGGRSSYSGGRSFSGGFSRGGRR